MTIGFRMPDHQEQAKPVASETRAFDPDRRIEKRNINDSHIDSFNPDKRLSDTDALADAQNDAAEPEDIETEIEKAITDYIKELKGLSEVPDTIPDKPFGTGDLRRLSKEELIDKRIEFYGKKNDLRRQWEIANGREWPKYEKDVVNADGIVVRKAGSYYDAHHIKPLCLGGKNEVENITPLSMDNHQSKEGIHRQDGACNKLTKLVGERQQ